MTAAMNDVLGRIVPQLPDCARNLEDVAHKNTGGRREVNYQRKINERG